MLYFKLSHINTIIYKNTALMTTSLAVGICYFCQGITVASLWSP